VKEPSARLVFEHEWECSLRWSAMQSIAGEKGCPAETLRKWVRRADSRDYACRAIDVLRVEGPDDPGRAGRTAGLSVMQAATK
jgi:transposase-like protein